MTLVVSDITRYGIVVVGDSAVSIVDENEDIVEVLEDAAKVQYSEAANIGIAMWGNGSVGEKSIDLWIAEFLDSCVSPGDDLELVGQSLAEQLNAELSQMSLPWDELRCGFHLTGYKDGVPRLWHIHTGHQDEPQHELRLYLDFPESKGLSDNQFRSFLTEDAHQFPKYCHLRNGYINHFATLFDGILNYSFMLRNNFGIRFPQDSPRGRLDFYKLLVQFVAQTLIAAGEYPGVNDRLSAMAFDQKGIVVDERIKVKREIKELSGDFRLRF